MTSNHQRDRQRFAFNPFCRTFRTLSEIGSFGNIRRWEQRVAKLPGYKQPLQLLPMEDVEVVGAA
jgi:hypothetical protein